MESERNFTESSVWNGFGAPAQAERPQLDRGTGGKPDVGVHGQGQPAELLAGIHILAGRFRAGRTTAGGAPVVPDAAKQRYWPKQGNA